jgi:ribonuclease HI
MKYYAVAVGRTVGIFKTWAECQEQVNGFSNAKFKSFSSEVQALDFIKPTSNIVDCGWDINSINCDGAYSSNTRVMEFKIKDTSTSEILLEKSYEGGTNNLAEFLALYYSILLLEDRGWQDRVIYTDSVTAINWVNNKSIKTKYNLTFNPDLNKEIQSALNGLLELDMRDYKIQKWKTNEWGQIPSDFNRK